MTIIDFDNLLEQARKEMPSATVKQITIANEIHAELGIPLPTDNSWQNYHDYIEQNIKAYQNSRIDDCYGFEGGQTIP